MKPPRTLREAVRRAAGPAVTTLQVLARMTEEKRNAWVDAHPLDAMRIQRAEEKWVRRAQR